MQAKIVKEGQALKISARGWSETQRVVSDILDDRPIDGGKALDKTIPSQNIILVLNTENEAFDIHEIAVIDKPAVSPADNDHDFFIRPNFEIKKATGSETETPVILLEPSNPDNAFTRAIIAGTGIVKIKVNSAIDLYAKTSDGKTYLESARSGQFKIIWKETAVDADGLSWAFVAFQPPGGTNDSIGFFQVCAWSDENSFGYQIYNADAKKIGIEAPYAGIVLAGKQIIEVPEVTMKWDTKEECANGLIYLDLVYNPELELGSRYTAEPKFLKQNDSFSDTPNVLPYPLATISQNAEIQIHKGREINLNGKYLV